MPKLNPGGVIYNAPVKDMLFLVDEWLGIVIPSGRGMKLDIKDDSAMTSVLKALRLAKQKHGEEFLSRLVVNADVMKGPGGRSALPKYQVLALMAMHGSLFPSAGAIAPGLAGALRQGSKLAETRPVQRLRASQ